MIQLDASMLAFTVAAAGFGVLLAIIGFFLRAIFSVALRNFENLFERVGHIETASALNTRAVNDLATLVDRLDRRVHGLQPVRRQATDQ